MADDRIAFVVISTNDRYVYKAIVTLLSVKEKNKENKNFEYFICGAISDKYRKVIEKYDVKVLKLSSYDPFKSDKKVKIKPNMKFEIASIPERLYQIGYEYSFVLDGDIFCLNKIPIEPVRKIKELGFIKGKPAKHTIYMKHLSKSECVKAFDLKQRDFEHLIRNSGVGVFNNESFSEK